MPAAAGARGAAALALLPTSAAGRTQAGGAGEDARLPGRATGGGEENPASEKKKRGRGLGSDGRAAQRAGREGSVEQARGQ